MARMSEEQILNALGRMAERGIVHSYEKLYAGRRQRYYALGAGNADPVEKPASAAQ
jgi:predicted transcriptional regulator